MIADRPEMLFGCRDAAPSMKQMRARYRFLATLTAGVLVLVAVRECALELGLSVSDGERATQLCSLHGRAAHDDCVGTAGFDDRDVAS